tara:strand:+ start:2265 stop:5261 length:2997 start_codon:yes stop_codon:yes gene_type:complete
MSAQKFKFVSPGVFLNEIDNSQLPKQSPAVGPIIIGRASQGPAMQPVRVESMADFIETFGNPIAGSAGTDVWREGNGNLAPSYAAYAVQAYLRNSGPVNFVRLLGVEHKNATAASGTSQNGEAGFGAGGKAYAILIARSGSAASEHGDTGNQQSTHTLTAAVAGIIYTTDGTSSITVKASGSATTSAAGHNTADKSVTSAGGRFVNTISPAGSAVPEFKLHITDETNSKSETIVFNFNRNSDRFIRKVLNTNPTLTTTAISQDTTGPRTKYWLGETFEQHINDTIITAPVATAKLAQSEHYAVAVAEIYGQGSNSWGDYTFESKEGQTGWFISQQTAQTAAARGGFDPVNMQRLFKFHGLGYGESLQKRFKVSIQDIRAANQNSPNPYGTFTVVIRDIRDTDEVPIVVERFANCNLNPQSSNYIARKIGDTYSEYDETKKRNRFYGSYPNISRYIRVEVHQDVDNGSMEAELLPFGFIGPPALKTVVQNNVPASRATVHGATYHIDNADGTRPKSNWLLFASGSSDGGTITSHSPAVAKLTLDFPKLALRLSASDGALSEPTDAYFGIRTTRGASSTEFDASVLDILRALPHSLDAERHPTANSTQEEQTARSFAFSLDDVCGDTTKDKFYYLSGSRASGHELCLSKHADGWRKVLSSGIDRFTAPFFGGHDGVNVREQDPFNNTRLGTSAQTSYAYASVERAIDLVTDPEVIESNIMTIPGLTNATLTKKLIDTCEARGDSLAVVDLPDVYTPPHEAKKGSFKARTGTLSSVVSTFEQRGINSSYGCTYYPWVMIYDEISDKNVWVPPSVIALGVFANTERRAAVWFAPAGFNRGGLTEGSAGLPVINVSEKLTSADRDELYAANINPIATFPAEGIVVFGQKTLQVTPSALDRINVRRLMIFVKKRISRIANNLLFDQNVQTTWLRFVSEVKPFLESVKLGFGLSDFAVVLDSSTTTPDLVDRNIMYAKIFLKPARAIEFIAIDFVITNTGAAFED